MDCTAQSRTETGPLRVSCHPSSRSIGSNVATLDLQQAAKEALAPLTGINLIEMGPNKGAEEGGCFLFWLVDRLFNYESCLSSLADVICTSAVFIDEIHESIVVKIKCEG